MTYNKGDHDELGWLVKEIAFCDDEWLKLIWIDSDASKGSSEELAKELDVSPIQIDTYRSNG